MPTLPTKLREASERPHSRGPFVWLWDVELERRTFSLPPVVFRFSSLPNEITWPPGAPSAPTWYPFEFDTTEIEQTNEGDLPGVDLAIDNTTRRLMPFLHESRGLEGNRADLYLTHVDALATPTYPNHEFIKFEFTVATSLASDAAISLRLEGPDLFQHRVPFARFTARRCRWPFGGPECGYAITPFAAFTECDHTVAACIERGDDEVLRQLPRLHPRRFGAFPGIPVGRSVR